MKNFLFIVLIFYSFIASGQNVKVEYSVNNFNKKYIGSLHINKINSYYNIKSAKVFNSDTVRQLSENTYLIRPRTVNLPEKKIYTNNFSSIYHIVIIQPNKEVIIAKDSVPEINWEIHSKNKKNILGYECEKAIANYRGSFIEAYFTTEIPLPFGPYKFKGLPGLILEVNSLTDKDKYMWIAEKIEFLKSTNLEELLFDKSIYDVDVKSLESLIRKFENNLNQNNKRADSSMPRGTTVDTKVERNSIEKVYEWEK